MLRVMSSLKPSKGTIQVRKVVREIRNNNNRSAAYGEQFVSGDATDPP